MYVTIIDGSLPDYLENKESGRITVVEESLQRATRLAEVFVKYGMTVVVEPERDGE